MPAGHGCGSKLHATGFGGGPPRAHTERAGTEERSRWLLVSAGRPRPTFHVVLDTVGGHCIVITGGGGGDGGRYLRRGGSVTDAHTPRYLRVRRRRHYTVQSAAVAARVPRIVSLSGRTTADVPYQRRDGVDETAVKNSSPTQRIRFSGNVNFFFSFLVPRENSKKTRTTNATNT